jgi:heme oxygenase
MKEDIDQMKTPRFQAEKMIIEHINNMHERSVKVRRADLMMKTPDIRGEYRRYIAYIPDPRIVDNLLLVVEYEIAGKGVEIYAEGDEQYEENRYKRNYKSHLLQPVVRWRLLRGEQFFFVSAPAG